MVVTRVCSLVIGPSEAGPQTTARPDVSGAVRPPWCLPVLGEMRLSLSIASLLGLSFFSNRQHSATILR